MNSNLTQEDVRGLLNYYPETGEFRWIARPCYSMKAGCVAGGKCPTRGYIRINIRGTLYLAHRLAWLYVSGAFQRAA